MPGRTLTEKIAERYAQNASAPPRQGDIIRIRPKHVMTHDNTGAVIPKFHAIFERAGTTPRVFDPSQPVFAIDHDIQNHSPENLAKYAKIDRFSAEHEIDYYPPGTGISHQVMVEQGYVTPGSLVVGSDSHSNLYGALAALGTPVVRTDAACIWATGSTWWQVPRVARCTLTGTLAPGVVGKDVIIALCGLFNNDEVLNHAVEFTGEGVASLTMDQRMTIANMTTEWGALAGIFPFDETLRDWLHARADALESPRRPGRRSPHSRAYFSHDDVESWWSRRLAADEDAHYAADLTLDLSTVIPHVSGPNHVKTMTPLPEIEQKKVPIQKAYLLSCVNARLEDLHEAARVLEGRKVAEGVEFFVAAASAQVQQQAEESGDWQTLLHAGAIPLPPGCGPCIGLGRGTVEPGQTAISATNRNFKGRMGSRDAEVYLASPAVVAASAAAGYICAPTRFESHRPAGSYTAHPRAAEPADATILDGFPRSLDARCLYLPADNLNTDGIYAGKWTYKDDLTPEQMAAVVFENYDPAFADIYQPGDIIVAGRNFGTGSSREQAATALMHRGVPCVVAASFSETYRRNAFNNGFLTIECPDLVDHLARTLDAEAPTVPGPTLTIDFTAGTITADGQPFPFPPLSPVAQELVIARGAENLAAASLATP